MDPAIEIFSLKDSVWKLNTRVLILENFIAKQFGTNALLDVHKQESIISASNTSTIPSAGTHTSSINQNKPLSSCSSEKQRPNKKSSSTNQTPQSRKKRKVASRVSYNEDDSSDEDYSLNENTESDVLLIPKNEIMDEDIRNLDMDVTEINSTNITKPNVTSFNEQTATSGEENEASFLREDDEITFVPESSIATRKKSSVFEETVLTTLTELKEDVSEILIRLGNQGQQRMPARTETQAKLPVKLPLSSLKDLQVLESWVEDPANRSLLIDICAAYGGPNAIKIVRGILKNVFSAGLAQRINYTGTNGKIAFQDLKFRSIIIDATVVQKLSGDAKNEDILVIVKNWFTNSRDLGGGRRKRQKNVVHPTND